MDYNKYIHICSGLAPAGVWDHVAAAPPHKGSEIQSPKAEIRRGLIQQCNSNTTNSNNNNKNNSNNNEQSKISTNTAVRENPAARTPRDHRFFPRWAPGREVSMAYE